MEGADLHAGEPNCRQANGQRLSHIDLRMEGTSLREGYIAAEAPR